MQEPLHINGSERIAFLGGGSMARALISGLLRERIAAHRICVGEPRTPAREALAADLGVAVSADNAQAVAGASLVVLAVKPQDAPSALQALHVARTGTTPAPVLLSIAAGLRIEQLAQSLPADVSIIRAMPNRPALVGAGITGLYAQPNTPAHAIALAELVGRAAGRAVWVRAESQLDIVTALSGSGPAYFFLLAEQLARAAEALGLPAQTAAVLATETLYGAGALAHQASGGEASAATLAEERRAVTSRGGTTEAALRVLQQGGFDALIARALQAAALRATELAAGAEAAATAASPPVAIAASPTPPLGRAAPPESVFGPGHRR